MSTSAFRWQANYRSRTFLLIDLGLYVDVDAQDEDVGEDVEGSHAEKNLRIIERYLLRYLHHPQDDDHIRSVKIRGSVWSPVCCWRMSTHICGLTAMIALVLRRKEENLLILCILNLDSSSLSRSASSLPVQAITEVYNFLANLKWPS